MDDKIASFAMVGGLEKLYAALCIIPLVGLWYLIRVLWRAHTGPLRNVPGPFLAKYTSLWRVCFVYSGEAHEKYKALHGKYGPVVQTAPNVLDLSNPEVIPQIYSIGSKYLKSDFYQVFSSIYKGATMPSMFSTQDPDFHKSLKRPVAQKFSMTSMRSLEPVVDVCMDIFLRAMRQKAGSRVDLGTWVQWYAFDVIGAITFDQRFGFMEHEKDIRNVIEGLEFGLCYGGIVGQVPNLHKWLLGNERMYRLRKRWLPDAPDPVGTVIDDKMVMDGIDQYDKQDKRATTSRTDFLAYLREREGSTMSNTDLMNHLTNNLLAGSDTTAISLRSIFYYISGDPRVYRKVQEEIMAAEKAGQLSQYISYGESLQLKYLQFCLKEAGRMHPGVSYPLERVVPKLGEELSGVFVPGGTIVGVNPAVIHRDRSIFGEDADTFRPERWLATDDEGLERVKVMERSLLTFGAGARTCIGKNISIMEMGKLVPQILREFDVALPDGKEWTVHTWWFAKQSNLSAIFTPKENGGK